TRFDIWQAWQTCPSRSSNQRLSRRLKPQLNASSSLMIFRFVKTWLLQLIQPFLSILHQRSTLCMKAGGYLVLGVKLLVGTFGSVPCFTETFPLIRRDTISLMG